MAGPAEFEELLRLVLEDDRERQTVAITIAGDRSSQVHFLRLAGDMVLNH